MAHTPLSQGEPAAQPLPHEPQLLRSVASVDSQPFDATPSQSPNPLLQRNPHAPVPVQDGEFAFIGAGHGAAVNPRPSALQMFREVALAHVVAPGVQTHPAHVPPEHVDVPEHAAIIEVSPSLLHVRAVRASTHVDDPGVHASVRQTPALQRCIDPQAIGVVPSPSPLQTCRVFASEHVALPGTHAMQLPPLHVWPEGQGIGVVAEPSTLQTARSCVVASHSVAPGAHTLVMQLPARHDCPAAQALVVVPAPCTSQVCVCVGSAHVVCPGTHDCATHACAALQ